MPKFRKKPVVIEAVEWEGNIESEDEISNFSRRPVTIDHGNPDYLLVEFSDKIIAFSVGDWLIKEADGEFHSADTEAFYKTHEVEPVAN